MTVSFRVRLALQWLLWGGLLLAAANLAIYVGIRAFLTSNLDTQIRTLAETERASALDDASGAHLHESAVDAPATDGAKFVQLMDGNGHVLMQSPHLGVTRRLADDQAIVDAFAGKAPLFAVAVGTRPGRMVVLRTAGATPYLVGVGVYTDGLDSTLAWIRGLLVSVWFGALAATAAVGFVLASRALRPVRRITAQARAMALGDGLTRLDQPAADDEIGRMTRLLNDMLDRLFGAIDANRRFAADASHELRAPMTGMLGEVSVALKRERTIEEYQRVLTMVQERLHEMTGLTDSLMQLVRVHEQRQIPVTDVLVAPLVSAIVAGARAAADKPVEVEVDVPPDLVIYADRALLERAIGNVIRNAVQYSEAGGHVTVSARLEPRHGDWVTDEVIVTVHDRGPGIPAEARERVFERFYRVDASRSRQTGGVGLGLAIAHDVIRLFKGTICVLDTPGPGTTVAIRLPGARSSADVSPAPEVGAS